MKAGIFTPYSLDPIHPRTEMYLSFFKEAGIEASIENSNNKPAGFLSLLSKAFLNIFDFQAVHLLSLAVKKYDCILIQDLRYLPLAVAGRRQGKLTVYETLDNSVFIRVHNQKRNVFYPVIKLLTPIFCMAERCVARFFTDHVIVNSAALVRHFRNRAHLVYYASPFESAGIVNNYGKKPVLLYLGAVSADKGIHEVLSLTGAYGIRTFIFGDCQDRHIAALLEGNQLITWKKKMNSEMLKQELRNITEEFFLIGLSLIKPVHYSYATQEANKEIDYMSMGIPFIGNHRLTTKEKIVAGCGVFVDDPAAISNLINNPDDRKKKSSDCRDYYNRHYSVEQFKVKLKSIFSAVGNG
ncbi:MAG: hypothetical protein JXA72_07165 [Bacteroidales bacterium]|nr:hypothetical protein [Bacteroidales bacterium]